MHYIFFLPLPKYVRVLLRLATNKQHLTLIQHSYSFVNNFNEMSSEYIHTYIHTVAKFANFLGPLLARSYLFTRIILSTTLAKFRQSSLWLKFPQIDKVRQIRQQNFVKSASFVTAYIKGAVCSVFPETRHSCREANLTCL